MAFLSPHIQNLARLARLQVSPDICRGLTEQIEAIDRRMNTVVMRPGTEPQVPAAAAPPARTGTRPDLPTGNDGRRLVRIGSVTLGDWIRVPGPPR